MTQTAASRVLAHMLGAGERPPRALLGAKAHGLDRLARLGLPTPPGFCLTTAAREEYLRAHALDGEGAALRRQLPDDAARRGLARIERANALPAALDDRLARSLDELATVMPIGARLAVRSSADAEDGGPLFAVAHGNVLGVARSPRAVDEAVRECWASLWSERAVACRSQQGWDQDGGMAVVVQQLVESTASAVAFTRDPLTGADSEVVVSVAAAAAGDAVTARVAKRTLRLLDVDRALLDDSLAVPEDALPALVELALAVERAWERPVDVEAAYDGRDWLLVQARAAIA